MQNLCVPGAKSSHKVASGARAVGAGWGVALVSEKTGMGDSGLPRVGLRGVTGTRPSLTKATSQEMKSENRRFPAAWRLLVTEARKCHRRHGP